jgi:thiamine biosynthesis lipoprotein
MHQYQFSAMTVNCELQLAVECENTARQVAQKIIQNTLRLQQKYNFHDSESWLNRCINNRSSKEVLLDSESAQVLSQVKQFSLQLANTFDITVGTLKPCFKQGNLVKALNLRKRLQKSMGDQAWQLDDDKLVFSNDICRFDLGGVIKEYAVDQAAQIVREAGLSGALINFGGDIYVCGTKSSGAKFVVGVKSPRNPEQMMFSVDLQDQALTTSGHYEREKQLGKRKISHILSERGIDSRVLSVTTISESVLCSGIYSTALTIKPELPIGNDMSTIFIDSTLKIHQSAITLEPYGV